MRSSAMRLVVALNPASMVEMLFVSGYQLRAIIQRGGQELPSTRAGRKSYLWLRFHWNERSSKAPNEDSQS
jgi:hypothetical protein